MACRLEVREGMSVCRVLATSNVTAHKANAKFIPCRALRQAFLAAVGAGFHFLDRVEMLAAIVHGESSGVVSGAGRGKPLLHVDSCNSIAQRTI